MSPAVLEDPILFTFDITPFRTTDKAFLEGWSKKDKTVIAFESDGMFTLPNEAKRAPDAFGLKRKNILHYPKPKAKKVLPGSFPILSSSFVQNPTICQSFRIK